MARAIEQGSADIVVLAHARLTQVEIMVRTLRTISTSSFHTATGPTRRPSS